MKQIHTPIRFVILLVLIALMASCKSDILNKERPSDQVVELEDGRLRVPIHLNIADREQIETKTKSRIFDVEKTIKNIQVLVFDATSGTIIERVSAEMDPVNPLRAFAKISRRNEACKIGVYANIPSALTAQFNAATSVYELSALKLSTSVFDNATTEGLPLVAPVSSEFAALTPATLRGFSAPLQFAYARIDLYNTAPAFTLVSAQLIDVRSESFMVEPTLLSVLGSPVSTSMQSAASNQVEGLYLFECKGTAPAYILLKGTNTGYETGFYKLKLQYTKEDALLSDVNRAKRYVVNLKSVKGAGYTTAEEALANEPGNVEYEVTIDDGTSNDITISNGNYYLGLSNSEYYIYADDAVGVIVSTIAINAPSTVSNAAIKLTGTGMTLYNPQPGLTIISDTEATFQKTDGTLQSIPLRINFASSTIDNGQITIRVGDLVKNITVVKRAYISEETPATIPFTDFGGSDFSEVVSNTSRITVDGSNNLSVKPESGPSTRVFSTVNAFSKNERGNVVIAVKRNIENIVYYEKYADNTVGLFIDKSLASSLRDQSTQIIKEAGYGVATTQHAPGGINLRIGSQLINSVPGSPSADLFEDYIGMIYGVTQQTINTVSQAANALQVTVDAAPTKSYIYPNFAKGVYQGPGGTTTTMSLPDGTVSSPFAIRTAKQVKNITPMVAASNSKYFHQEREVDLSVPETGGAAVYTTAVVAGNFQGHYSGASNKLKKLKITASTENIGLFERITGGSIQDLILSEFNVKGYNLVGALAGSYTPPVTINRLSVEDSNIEATIDNAGGVIGQSVGSSTTASRLSHISITNTTVKALRRIGGIAGYLHQGETTTLFHLDYCETDARTHVTGESGDHGSGGIGGLVGVAHDGRYYITNSANRATVEATQYAMAGGIVGDFDGPATEAEAMRSLIDGCKNSGSIIGGSMPYNEHRSMGGIVGHIWRAGDIKNSTNNGTIYSKRHPAGGIAGHIWYNTTISHCRNRGDIISEGTSSGNYIGGILSRTEGGPNLITNCQNYGNIRSSMNYIGGIVGFSTFDSPIEGCFHQAIISGGNYVGGITGRSNGSITDCLVVGQTEPGVPQISGIQYVGGITGSLNDSYASIIGANVVDTQNDPTVSFVAGTANIGGISGYNTGSIKQSIYLAKIQSDTDFICPIVGGGNAVPDGLSVFYLSSPSFNAKIVSGGGLGYSTEAFRLLPPPSPLWEQVVGYPYPKLIHFPVPAGWPIAN